VTQPATLFSYVVRYDEGGAPNPFWGACTLVICKPGIRENARRGDWVVGLGSSSNPVHHDYRGQIVYVMRVDDTKTMKEYDEYTRAHLPQKIPLIKYPLEKLDPGTDAWKLRLGDSIYDFSGKRVRQRAGVHRAENRKTDLSGKNALVSREFVYYGREAIELPDELRGILHEGQGFSSVKNAPHLGAFLEWWSENRPTYEEDRVRGLPQWDVFSDPKFLGRCASGHRIEAEKDLPSQRGE
jgi:hypothetical protein